MSSEPAILARIREALESVLERAEAARVMLDALGRWGPRVPSDVAEIAAFVEGPLTAALEGHADDAAMVQLLVRVDEILATAAAPTRQHRVEPEILIDVEGEWPDERTADLPLAIGAPVPVLVVAGGPGLASRLRTALGIEQIAVVTRGEREGIARALEGDPLLVVVDATDVPRVAPEELLEVLGTGAAVCAVWGIDLPYGRRFAELCERARRPHVAVGIADGMETLLDLVTSRRG